MEKPFRAVYEPQLPRGVGVSATWIKAPFGGDPPFSSRHTRNPSGIAGELFRFPLKWRVQRCELTAFFTQGKVAEKPYFASCAEQAVSGKSIGRKERERGGG